MFRLPRTNVAALLALLVPLTVVAARPSPAHAVGTRRFVIESQEDFKKGELVGVSVDSIGQLRSGFELGALEAAGVDSSWDAIEHDGGLLVATGNQGKLLRVKGGKVAEVASLKAIALTSIARAFGSRVIVGAMPGEKLYELKGDQLVEFAKLEPGTHVWALAYDASKSALFVATGPEGKLFRVTADGTAQVYFDSDQPHLVSVAVAAGKVACGSSGKARLYQLAGPGRAQVLYDFETTEVRALAAGSDGSLFAVANELKGEVKATPSHPDQAAVPQRAAGSKGKGVLYRFSPDGTPEELFESKDEQLVSLTVDASGNAVVGTGVEGRIYQVGADHQNVLLADVEERQVARVLLASEAEWVVSSDPVVFHAIRGRGGVNSVWTSAVLDAGGRARFGRLDFEGTGKLSLSTRSGNTNEPDATWSDWSAESGETVAVQSPQGRYLQVRARMTSSAVLRRVEIPFVTDNLRPVLTAIEAASEAAPSSEGQGHQKSGQPIDDGEPKAEIKVTFTVDNPDEDELRYYVDYQPLGKSQWFSALEPGEVLKRAELKWKTADLPEGRYRLRVTATDELSNPPLRVKRHTLESSIVLVDNTPPRLVGLKAQETKLSGTAVDGLGPIRRIETRIAGRHEWIPLEPTDGVYDQAKETFAVDLAEQLGALPAMVTVRAFDTAGNSTVEHVTLGEQRK